MKILYVVQAYHPSVGGVQWLIQNLAQRMSADYDDEVTVFTTTAHHCQLFIDPSQPAMPPGTEQINGVTVRRFDVFNQLTWLRLNAARIGHKLRLPGQDWLRGLYFGPLVPGLSAAVAHSQAEVVVASSFPMIHMYAALKGGQRVNKPVVLIGTVHPTDSWGYDLPRMYRAIESADAYVALSTYERDYLVAHGIPARHIDVVGAGVDITAFDEADLKAAGQAFRQQHSLGDDPVALLVGRQTAYKRIDVALEAMQQVWSQIPAAQLLIAGARTNYSVQLQKMVVALPPERQEQVTIVDDFDERDKPALLAASDVLLQPSQRESFGIVFLEAWAAGKPVIGARSGAATAVIDENRDGLLAAYGDAADWARAIHQLLANPRLRVEMGARGRNKVQQRYTWDVITQRFRQIYTRLL